MRAPFCPPLSVVVALAACSGGTGASQPADVEISCEGDGWCWVRGAPLEVAGDDALGTAWATGPAGRFARWDLDADQWIPMPVPTDRWIISAWVGADDDAWASDDQGSAWHFDGATWTERPASGFVSRVMGAPDRSAWAVVGAGGIHGTSSGGEVIPWQGQGWGPAVPSTEYCIGGDYLAVSADEVWAVGLVCPDEVANVAEVRRHRQGSWERVGEPISVPAWFPRFEPRGGRIRFRIYGAFEWSGVEWTPVEEPDVPQGTSDDQIWNGVDYSAAPYELRCEAAYRLDDEHTWCWGEGRIALATDDGWAQTLPDPYAETASAAQWGKLPASLWAGGEGTVAWGSSVGHVLQARDGQLERLNGGRWHEEPIEGVHDIDGAAADDVWIATDAGLVHDVRGELVEEAIAELPEGANDVHALGRGEVVASDGDVVVLHDAAGANTVLHHAPEGWKVDSIAGSGPRDLWVFQSNKHSHAPESELLHFDGTRWSSADFATESWSGKLATDAGETWLLSNDEVRRLGAPAVPIPIATNGMPRATLALTDDAVWVTTATQALRHPR